MIQVWLSGCSVGLHSGPCLAACGDEAVKAASSRPFGVTFRKVGVVAEPAILEIVVRNAIGAAIVGATADVVVCRGAEWREERATAP